jgi:hypothetical protein
MKDFIKSHPNKQMGTDKQSGGNAACNLDPPVSEANGSDLENPTKVGDSPIIMQNSNDAASFLGSPASGLKDIHPENSTEAEPQGDCGQSAGDAASNLELPVSRATGGSGDNGK